MKQTFEQSSNIASAEWENEVLTVTFKSGAAYKYEGVPQGIYDEFCTAISPGQFFASNIRGKFEGKKVNAQ